jgi:hypothetical protein
VTISKRRVFRGMRIGSRLALGFAGLLAIAVLVGATARSR